MEAIEDEKDVDLRDRSPNEVYSRARELVVEYPEGRQDARDFITRFISFSLCRFNGAPLSITCVALCPVGLHVAVGTSNGDVLVWDVGEGGRIESSERHTEAVSCIASSHAGDQLVSGSRDGSIRRWDPSTARPLHQPLKHGDAITSIAISQDASLLASTSDDKSITVWDVGTGNRREIDEMAQRHGVATTVAFSPNRSMLAFGYGDGDIGVCDVETYGQRRFTSYKNHGGRVLSVSFSPNGQTAVSAAIDGTISKRDVMEEKQANEELPVPVQLGMEISAATFTKDALQSQVAVSSSAGIHLIDMSTGETMKGPLRNPVDAASHLAFSADGLCLGTIPLNTVLEGKAVPADDKIVQVWNTDPHAWSFLDFVDSLPETVAPTEQAVTSIG